MLVKLRRLGELSFTCLFRTEDIFVNFNLIDRVLRQALHTKVMPTVPHTSRILQLDVVVAHLAHEQSEGRSENLLNSELRGLPIS